MTMIVKNKRKRVGCGLCKERYGTVAAHNPMCIPECGHSFCRTCLDGRHDCPLCQAPIERNVVNYVAIDPFGSQQVEENELVDIYLDGRRDKNVVFMNGIMTCCSNNASMLSRLIIASPVQDSKCLMALESLIHLHLVDPTYVAACPHLAAVVEKTFSTPEGITFAVRVLEQIDADAAVTISNVYSKLILSVHENIVNRRLEKQSLQLAVAMCKRIPTAAAIFAAHKLGEVLLRDDVFDGSPDMLELVLSVTPALHAGLAERLVSIAGRGKKNARRIAKIVDDAIYNYMEPVVQDAKHNSKLLIAAGLLELMEAQLKGATASELMLQTCAHLVFNPALRDKLVPLGIVGYAAKIAVDTEHSSKARANAAFIMYAVFYTRDNWHGLSTMEPIIDGIIGSISVCDEISARHLDISCQVLDTLYSLDKKLAAVKLTRPLLSDVTSFARGSTAAKKLIDRLRNEKFANVV